MKESHNFLGNISSLFIDKYRIVYLMIIAIIVVGSAAYIELPREQYPELVVPRIRVRTNLRDVSSNEIESSVTDVIEGAVKDIEDIEEISSTSSLGLSTVDITFSESVDIDEAYMNVGNSVNEVSRKLPADASIQIARFSLSNRPIMNVSISGNYPLDVLKGFADDIDAEINNISGVSETELTGGLEAIVSIQLDQNKMSDYKLNMSTVASVIRSNNKNVSSGLTELDTLDYSMRVIGEISELETLGDVVVSSLDGYPIYLKDISSIEMDFEEATSISQKYEADKSLSQMTTPSISIAVIRESGSDVVGVTEEIIKAIDEKRGIYYPDDLIVSYSNVSAVVVEDSLSDVMSNAISGLMLVVVVLFIFIGFRESLIVAFIIPISMMLAFAAMTVYGITLNTMAMVALIVALGMLVDNAIVIIENIDRIRDEGSDVISSSKFASNQVGPAIFAATLTTLAAFLPLSLLDGNIGAYIEVIPVVIMFAIIASFLMSIIVTPALCSRLLSKHKTNKNIPVIAKVASIVLIGTLTAYSFKGTVFIYILPLIAMSAMYIKLFKMNGEKGKLKEQYGQILDGILKSKLKKAVIVLTVVVMFVGSLSTIALGILKIELLPEDFTTTIDIHGELPLGYLLDDTQEIAYQVEDKLYKYPEIKVFESKINKGLFTTTLEVYEGTDIVSFVEILENDMNGISGARISIEKNSMGYDSGGSAISFNVIGDNSELVKEVTDDIARIVSETEGTTNVESTLTGGPPELKVVVDRDKASLYGLTIGTVSSRLTENFQGVKASTMTIDGEDVDIHLSYDGNNIRSISDINSIPFYTAAGIVYFDQIAKMEETKGLQSITHKDLDRQETITSDVLVGYNVGAVNKNIMKEVNDYILPQGVTISVGGETSDTIETFIDMGINMGVVIVIIYILLAAQFNSLIQPVIMLVTVPLSVIGSIFGLILTGNSFGAYAFFGIIALVGIAINNAIVLVDYINSLRSNGMEIGEAVVLASKTRLTSVLSTTITTIGGMLPLAMKDPIYAQLGYSLIFGLFVATILTLVIVPIVYMSLESTKVKFKSVVPVLVDER